MTHDQLECGGTDVFTLYLSGKSQFDLCTVLQNNRANFQFWKLLTEVVDTHTHQMC